MISHNRPGDLPPEPLHRPWLIAALICFAVLLFLFIASITTSSPYLYPTGWLVSCASISFIPAILAVLCAIRTFLTIRYSSRSRSHRLTVTTVAIFCLCSPLLYLLTQSTLNHRVTPLRSVMSANAMGIAQSAFVYANDNSGHFPPHPAVLILNGELSPKQIVNPLESAPYAPSSPTPPATAWPTIAAEVDRYSGFTYAAADLTIPPTATSEMIIVLYSRPSRYIPDGRVLAFADGHVDFIQTKDLPATFTASNTARANLGLPPFTLDGPPPAPSEK